MNDNNQTSGPAGPGKNPVIEPAKFEPVAAGAQRRLSRLRVGTVVTSLALLVSALAAWFVLTGKAVYVATDPAGAKVEIHGGFKLQLADHFLIRPGDYRLQITAPGYHPLQQTLTVSTDQNQQLSFRLRRLPGRLAVTTSPEVAAKIRIDGEDKGVTPKTVRDLEPGTHNIGLTADRYQDYEQTVEIEGLDHEQSLQARLTPAWADVTLSSSPAAADVLVDDEKIGQTPLTAPILQGPHVIVVKLAGYKGWKKALTVTANQPLTLPEITLQPADAVVQISSSPAGAGVTVDGDYKGQTPLEVALMPDKTAVVKLFKQGYKETSRNIKVRSGDNRSLHIDLEGEIAAVEILADPPDAELYVDGAPAGRAAQVLKLTTREHRIEIRKRGYVDYQTSLTPRPGLAQQLKVTLKTQRQARLESFKPVMQTAAGQTIKLMRPAPVSFTMGASRREAGRRANEVLHNVKLTRPFYLSVNEVTNAEYRQFDAKHSSGQVQGENLDGDKQPVVNVSWQEAARYCNWLSRRESLKPFYREKDGNITGIDPAAGGYRLPTEAEWAWAARVQGKTLLKFPWGENMPPPAASGNYADESASHILGRIIPRYKDGYTVTAPVGSFPANDKGLFDLGGNAAEWTSDFYDIILSEKDDVATDPLGPEYGDNHVIRGSSWAHGSVTELRLSYRDYGSKGRDDVGFRIARYLE